MLPIDLNTGRNIVGTTVGCLQTATKSKLVVKIRAKQLPVGSDAYLDRALLESPSSHGSKKTLVILGRVTRGTKDGPDQIAIIAHDPKEKRESLHGGKTLYVAPGKVREFEILRQQRLSAARARRPKRRDLSF